MVLYQVVIVAFCGIIKKCEAMNASHLEVTACYENTSSFDTVINKPRVVDVITGSIVHLLCHFCDGKEDYYPKWWFYKPRGSKNQKEVLTEIAPYDFSTNVLITPIHMLNIHDFSVNNSGIYTCKSPEIMKKGNVFMYILEGVFRVNVSAKVGTYSQWQEYKRNYFDTINKKFKISEEEPFKSLRTHYNITFKLTTIWEHWSECKEIDHQKGVRKILGRCRLRPSFINGNFEIMALGVFSNTATTSYLTDGYDISCRSLQLYKTAPEISEIIRNIPDYEAEETCHFINRAVKHKTNKDKYKHKTTKQVEENSHVTLLCTEATSNSDLKWFKDAKLLNSLLRNNLICKNEEEPHISVDTNNSLHILHISKNEEEFIRYSIYLGFVLSLAMTCYCAGVCVAWHRRSSFVDPLNINKKGIHEYHRLQCEREKLLK